MHDALKGWTLYLLAGLCLLAHQGCQTSAGPATQEAVRVVERLRAHRLQGAGEEVQPRSLLPLAGRGRVERVEGGFSVPQERLARGDSWSPARVVLPEQARGSFHVKDLTSGLTMSVALEGSEPAKASVVEGYVVYPNAYPGGADVVHRFVPEGTEDYLSFERAPAVPEVGYRLMLGAGAMGLRLVEDCLEVLDGSGAPRLRMAPPYLVGADGLVTRAHVSVSGCAVDTHASAPWGRPVTGPGSRECQVRVRWDAGTVKYPAVLDPVWSTTGSLVTGRRYFTTTLLEDGRVLAVGGFGAQNLVLSSAELYDPVTGTWATTGSLSVPRERHSAESLGSRGVLVVGGNTTGYQALKVAERYDPSTGTWLSAGPMSVARRGHRSVRLLDGRILVMGGSDISTWSSAELYDPETNTWAPTGSLATRRARHEAVLLRDGKVLVVGGENLKSSEIYDPAMGTWTPAAPISLLFFDTNPISTLLLDGRALLSGGFLSPAQLYDPTTNTWSSAGRISVQRNDSTVNRLPDGRVLVVGGLSFDVSEDQGTLVDVYEPVLGSWRQGVPLNTGRWQHASCLLRDGRVLVAGGFSPKDRTPLASTEVLLVDVDDETAPSVTLTSPAEGAWIDGEAILTASASDDYSVRRVEFYDGDSLIDFDASAPYSVTWYSRWSSQWGTGNGPHVLTAKAYDPSGNVATSAPITVVLNNDITPPTVTITSPVADSAPRERVTLSAEVSDDRGVVARVEFYDGRKLLGTDFDAPYSMDWELGDVPGGPHTLGVKAYDPAGNEGTSSVSLSLSQPGTAAYDSTLHVPLCGGVGAVCDSGSYLAGQGPRYHEPNQPNTLQGTCADGMFGGPDLALDRIRISTLEGGPMETGKWVRIDVTVWNPVQERQLVLFHTADANNPQWTHLTTLTSPPLGEHTLSTTFHLPVGALQAVRGNYDYQGSQMPCYLDSASSDIDHDDLAFAVGADVTAPTVSLVMPSAGTTVSGITTVYAEANDAAGVTRVEFYDGTALLGIDTTSPYAIPWNTAAAPIGAHTLVAKAYDASGNVGSSLEVRVTVTHATAQRAIYNATLGAPRCESEALSCDSGMLLNGRARLGPELNAPNTVDTCTDGTIGTYHSSQSLDRLVVFSLDGSPLAVGKTVGIEALVWWENLSSDVMDLYYASDASRPSWVFLGSKNVTSSGLLSWTYTLPARSARAVIRGVFRSGGSSGTCPGGFYTDVDDLVFNVQ